MNSNNFKYIFFIITIILGLESIAWSKINSQIIFKINNEIITNIDIENEKKFLQFLNPKLKNLSNQKIESISINSIKNRVIKEIELRKYFELNDSSLGMKYVQRFVSKSNYTNIENLMNELSMKELNYKVFEKNFLIDNLWREFIFNRFKSKVNIDINKLKNEINDQETEIEELNLSEILFIVKPNLKFDELKSNIYTEIEKSGFEAAASIYSISKSKDLGGRLGWIKSSQISKSIYSKINNIKKISEPIKTNNGYLIIKVNDRRKINEKINLDAELKKLVEIETENELNKLGYIFFNKLKKRTFISEK
tara:strand:- start:1030 stop:1956 length:927 start_codon:yes stop_codon:yes gene_type:complete